MSKGTNYLKDKTTGKALKRARELKGITRNQLATRLGITVKLIERYENGRTYLTEEKLTPLLGEMGISKGRFHTIRRGKTTFGDNRKVTVIDNSDRRSYQKNITKECKVLKSLRKEKGISQDNASALCGYSRPTIGHIENGRIELDRERIAHIVKSYGFEMVKFDEGVKKDQQRDEIIESCVGKIKSLDDMKLELVKNLLATF